jgi:hypothetical protein
MKDYFDLIQFAIDEARKGTIRQKEHRKPCEPCLCASCFNEKTIEGEAIIGMVTTILLKVESGKWSAKTALTKFLSEQKCAQRNGERRFGGWHNVKHEFAQDTLESGRGDL